MAVLTVLTWPDPALSTPCAPVEPDEDISALVSDMFDTMYDAPGRGLAAPQVGVLRQIFVTDVSWKEGAPTPMVFVNPSLTGQSTTLAVADEGCLSIPGMTVAVARPDWVDLDWCDPTGARHTRRFDGFAGVCVQHELDHLAGRVTFDRMAPADRATAQAMFLKGRS